MTLLEFVDKHPILTVIVLFIVCGSLVEIARAFGGRQ